MDIKNYVTRQGAADIIGCTYPTVIANIAKKNLITGYTHDGYELITRKSAMKLAKKLPKAGRPRKKSMGMV